MVTKRSQQDINEVRNFLFFFLAEVVWGRRAIFCAVFVWLNQNCNFEYNLEVFPPFYQITRNVCSQLAFLFLIYYFIYFYFLLLKFFRFSFSQYFYRHVHIYIKYTYMYIICTYMLIYNMHTHTYICI